MPQSAPSDDRERAKSFSLQILCDGNSEGEKKNRRVLNLALDMLCRSGAQSHRPPWEREKNLKWVSAPPTGNKRWRDARKCRRQKEKSNDGTMSSRRGRRSECRPEVAGAGAFADSVSLQSDTVTAVVEQAGEKRKHLAISTGGIIISPAVTFLKHI